MVGGSKRGTFRLDAIICRETCPPPPPPPPKPEREEVKKI